MQTRSSLRVVSLEDLAGNVYDVPRDVVPVYGNVLIGSLDYVLPAELRPQGDYHYHVLQDVSPKALDDILSKLSASPKYQNRIAKVRARNISSILSFHPRFQQVSRVHALVYAENGRVVVEDLASKNGTFVHGERSQRYEFTDDDSFAIGGREKNTVLKAYSGIKRIFGTFVGVDAEQGNHQAFTSYLGFQELLKKTGIPLIADIFHGINATPEAVLNSVSSHQLKVSPSDLYIFYFNCHGTRDGSALECWQGNLLKTTLEQELAKMRCKKLVCIDACFSSAGWSAPDASTLFVFCSRDDEVSYNFVLGNQFRAIASALSANKPIDFKNLPLAPTQAQHPLICGTSVVV